MEVFVWASCVGVKNEEMFATTTDGINDDTSRSNTSKEVYIHIHRYHITGKPKYMYLGMDFDMKLCHEEFSSITEAFNSFMDKLNLGEAEIELNNIDVLIRDCGSEYIIKLNDKNNPNRDKNCTITIEKSKVANFFNRLKVLAEWADRDEY